LPAAPPPAILIVDDSLPLARGLAALLKHAGYRTTAFTEGLSAIEFARNEKPAGAVIDVHLPDISGLILSQRLREELGPTAPIVVLSGDSSMEVLNSLPHVGATRFFRKPVSAASLVEHFRELFGTGAPAQSHG